jgi:hypothetical protein
MYSIPGSDDVGDCDCPQHASSRQNARNVAECMCDPGYYKVANKNSLLGGWDCQACTPGQFCYNNTNRTCPPHSTSFPDAKGVLDCYCGAGYANSTMQNEVELCVECPINYYCTGKGAIERCVANAVSPSQSQNASRCYCDWGWRGVNNNVCVECQSPTYCYGGIQTVCPGGSSSPPRSWDRTNCSCIPGYWGPVGGPCIMCGAGKYNNVSGCKACSSTVDTDCMVCQEGTYSTMLGRNSSGCDTCRAGTFSDPPVSSGGGTRCLVCQNGTYSLERSGSCTACDLGWYALTGSSACTACPVNTYLNLANKGGPEACMPCPKGTISSRIGNSDPACSACPPGSYQLNGTCASCVSGTYSVSASVLCTPCDAGTYSLANATSCKKCQAGKFAPQEGGAICLECPVGTYAPEPLANSLAGATVCSLCPIGWIASKNGSLNCSECPDGTYSPSGAGVCTSCPAGSWGLGNLGHIDNCTKCLLGKYSTTIGATRFLVCKDCWAGSYSNTTRASQVSQGAGRGRDLIVFASIPNAMLFSHPFHSVVLLHLPFHVIRHNDDFEVGKITRGLFPSKVFNHEY